MKIHKAGTPHRGFTLLEMLLVVAVIAVLAAIAIPNLELAGTRAKISRVRTDFRTISFGLEAYHVDSTAYPPSNDLGTTPSLLSTPVAYLSESLLPDPFFRANRFDSSTGNLQNSVYRYNNFQDGPEDPYANFHRTQYGSYWNYSNPPFATGGRLVINGQLGITSLIAYDATNGLISSGRLVSGQRSL